MGAAIATHRRLHENVAPAAIVALVCVGIAVGHVTTSRTHSVETQNAHER